MTDQEFISYCKTHCQTPRAGFAPEHINRLRRMAGMKEIPLGKKILNIHPDQMAHLMERIEQRNV